MEVLYQLSYVGVDACTIVRDLILTMDALCQLSYVALAPASYRCGAEG